MPPAAQSVAVRYQRVISGSTETVITLPNHEVYLLVLRVMPFPLSAGSNAAPPHAFVHRGTIADAAKSLGWDDVEEATQGDRIQLPATLLAELLEHANRKRLGQHEATRLAVRCFEAGLIANMWTTDLTGLGGTR